MKNSILAKTGGWASIVGSTHTINLKGHFEERQELRYREKGHTTFKILKQPNFKRLITTKQSNMKVG
jgi:hypothetical protein